MITLVRSLFSNLSFWFAALFVLLCLGFLAPAPLLADSGAALSFNPTTTSVLVGNTTVLTIHLDSVTDLYGYQFQVNYDASKLSATGAFVNSFFDTTSNAFIPSGWNATCAAGVCSFAASHLSPATATNGSGDLAQITFTGANPGAVTITFASTRLADRDGNLISHTTGTASITVSPAPPSLTFVPTTSSVNVGESVVVTIHLAAVTNLYGYQFRVNYDASKLNAAGAFDNSFFDTTTNAFIPSGWHATCSSGVCSFAASHLAPANATTGSGDLAQITFTGLVTGTVPLTFSATSLADRDGNLINHTVGTGTITVGFGPTTLSFVPAVSTIYVGDSVVVTIHLSSIMNLYGYQFQVNYDATKVNASGAFVNTFFDTTTNAFVPPGWNASCSAGVCSFAASHLAPAAPSTGSGDLAQITFTAIDPGNVSLTFTNTRLADRDGNLVSYTAGTGVIHIYGRATITGTVQLQGRLTPISSGTVTLTDSNNTFTPTVVSFDAATGNFTATVGVESGGSTYTLLAAHSVYLSNQLSGVVVVSNGTYPQPTTTLSAGDANNDAVIDILDISCVGGSYNLSPATCGSTGSSDINEDGIVNIFDLVLVGGNYNLTGPRPW